MTDSQKEETTLPAEKGHSIFEQPPQTAQTPIDQMVPAGVQYIAHQAYFIRRALECIADAVKKRGSA
jgi:hypothetical protein